MEKFGIYLLNKMRATPEEREILIDQLLHCVEKLNHKVYVYAAVTKVIAKEASNFGKEIFD
jgi:hypothetical protein